MGLSPTKDAKVRRIKTELRAVKADAKFFRANYPSHADAHRRFEARIEALNREIAAIKSGDA